MLINTNKPKPKKVRNAKLIPEEQMKRLQELDMRNISDYNNHVNLRNMIIADNESTMSLFFNRSY